MRALRITLPLALAALAACQGSQQAQQGPIKAEDFAATYADAVCQQATRCQSLAPYLLEQCQQSRERFLGGEDVAKGVAAGRLVYDAQQARTCVDGVLATDCLAGSFSDSTLAACLGAVQGKVAAGGACFGFFECAAGTCGGTSDTCPATCPEVLAAGAECSLHFGAHCDIRQGLLCQIDTEEGLSHCAKPKAEGQPCIDNSYCQSGLVCAAAADGEPTVCARLHKKDEPCSSDQACEQGLFCRVQGEGGVCAPRVEEGRPCGQNIETIDAALRGAECQDGLTCKGASLTFQGDALAGICAKPVGEGQGCTADQGNVQQTLSGCLSGLVCPGGTCILPPSHGFCTPHGECQSGVAWCDENSQCQPLKANGERLHSQIECKGGFCGDDGCADELNYCHES